MEEQLGGHLVAILYPAAHLYQFLSFPCFFWSTLIYHVLWCLNVVFLLFPCSSSESRTLSPFHLSSDYLCDFSPFPALSLFLCVYLSLCVCLYLCHLCLYSMLPLFSLLQNDLKGFLCGLFFPTSMFVKPPDCCGVFSLPYGYCSDYFLSFWPLFVLCPCLCIVLELLHPSFFSFSSSPLFLQDFYFYSSTGQCPLSSLRTYNFYCFALHEM